MHWYLLLVSSLGLVASTTMNFISGPPVQNTSSLIANPNYGVADAASTITLICTVRDAYGNAVANSNVTFSTLGTSTTLSPGSGWTDASGVVTTTIVSPTVQQETITAAVDPNIVVTATVNFTIGPPSASMSTWTKSPNGVPADGTSAISATVVIRDAQGRLITNQNVAFSGSSNSVTASLPNVLTNASGSASTSFTSTTPQNANLLATAGSAVLSMPNYFSGPMNSIVLTGISGGPTGTNSVPTVTAYDSGGRLALAYSSSVSFSSTDASAILPAAYTFSAADKGVHSFSSGVTLITPPVVSVTASATGPNTTSTLVALPVSAAYYYNLSPNVQTGTCLELSQGNTADSTNVIVNYCTSSARQNVRQDSNNTLMILNKCLAPTSAAANAAVVIQTCNNTPLQNWTQNVWWTPLSRHKMAINKKL